MASRSGPNRKTKLPPLSIARILYKRRLLVALTWLAGIALTAVVVSQLPSIYKSEALILVESQRIPEKFVASTVDLELRDRINAISQQILSYRRLLEIIEKFNLYPRERRRRPEEEIVAMMRDDIAVRVEEAVRQKQPGAFRVAYHGRDPRITALVASQLANLFIEENLRTREVYAVGTSEFLETQLVESRRRLEEQEARLSAYKLKHNGELPQQENVLISTASRLQLQLQGIQEAISRAQQQKLMLETSAATAQASAAAIERMIQEAADPQQAGLLGQPQRTSQTLEQQLAVALGRYTPDHPEVRGLQETLRAVRRMEEQERAGKADKANGAAAEGPQPAASPREARFNEMLIRERERIENLKAQALAAARQIETLEQERKQTVSQLDSLLSRLQRLPVREQELASLMRDYEISKANYQSLLDKRLAAQTAAEMEKRQKGERFTLLEAARVPETPVKPNRPLLLAAGVVLSLLLGVGAAFAVELPKDALLGEWELPPGIVILGRVPPLVKEVEAGVPARRSRLWPAFAALAVAAAGGAALALGWLNPNSARGLWEGLSNWLARLL
jgi:succinoglycan biosynthesis transport protein ExoP